MKILIVGGGVAGVTLAYFLQKNHKVTIIEKTASWRTIGYGIGIWQSGLSILKKIPLTSEFWNSGYQVEQGATLSANGNILYQMPFDMMTKGQSIAITFEREILHNAINNLLTNIDVRFNTTLKYISQSTSETEVEFFDETKEKFDLIVGADGIRSTIRSMIFGEKIKKYGWNIWGAWVPKSVAHFQGYYVLGGKNESVLSFPYHDKQAIGLMYRMESTDYPRAPKNTDEIFSHFPLLKEKIKDMVFAIENPQEMFNDSLSHIEMDVWYKNKVVLIGDAKHGMSPLTGMGTSLALEDAFVLAEELNKNQNTDIALKNFSKRRDKRCKSVKTFRKILESIGMLNSSVAENIRDLSIKNMPSILPSYIFKKMFGVKI